MRHMGLAEATAPFEAVRREPHPAEIVKRFNWLETGRHVWLEALERTPGEWDPTAEIQIKGRWPKEPFEQRQRLWEYVKTQCAFLEGSIKGNRVKITAEGIGRLRVWFDPELVDYGRPVSVSINRKSRGRLRLERSPETLLREVHRTGDTARLYWACLLYTSPSPRDGLLSRMPSSA